MHPTLLYWPTTLELGVGGMTVEVKPSHQYSIHYHATGGSRGATWENSIWLWSAYRGITEFLHVEEITSVDIHRSLLNIYGYQTLDVSTLRWCMVCFNSGDIGSA